MKMRHMVSPYLEELLAGGSSRFDRLTIRDIDNGSLLTVNALAVTAALRGRSS